MMKSIVTFIIIAGICLILTFVTGTLNGNLASIATSIIASIIIISVQSIITNFSHFKLLLYSKTICSKKDVRVSISYLFRIKVDNKYLLVKGGRINQWQPVGGVFKRYSDTGEIFNKLGILDDNFVEIDKSSRDDLRIRVKGTNLVPFIKWFDSQHGRELSAEREFYEELIRTRILNRAEFPFIRYKFIKRVNDGLKYDVHVGGMQILIADIYEVILDAKQISEFKKLMNVKNSRYIFVDEKAINHLGANVTSIPIARTAEWII